MIADQQQYNESRGSGIRTQNSRNDDDRVENRFNVNAVRQLQSNDRRGQEPMVRERHTSHLQTIDRLDSF